MKRIILFAAVWGLLYLPLAAGAQDEPPEEKNSVAEAVASMSAEVADLIANTEDANKSLIVGSFEGPGTGGPGLVAQFKRQFETKFKDKVTLIESDGYKLTGSYALAKNDATYAIVIHAKIRDTLGGDFKALRRRFVTNLTEQEDALALFNPSSVDVSKTPDPKAKAEKIVDSLKHPTVYTAASTKPVDPPAGDPASGPKPKSKPPANSVAKAGPDSPYGVELVIYDPKTAAYSPIGYDPASLDKGRARVDIKPGQIYAIRIHNLSPEYVGAAIAIDGVNIFHFSQNPHFQKLGKVAIRPNHAALIKGWHDIRDKSFEFLVTHFGETKAAELGVSEGIGTITVTFFKAITGPKGGDSAPSDAVGTTFGKPVDMRYGKFFGTFGPPLGAVSVQYTRPAPPQNLPLPN